MKKNMGSADSIIRIIIAVIGLILYFTSSVTGILGIVVLIFSIVLILTSFVRVCPLYFPLGINTNKNKTKNNV